MSADDQGLSLEEFLAIPEAKDKGIGRDEFERLGATAPTQEEPAPKTGQGLAGDVAATLRGVQEQVPFARDIGAAANAYIGNPLTGARPTKDFGKAKQELEARNAALAEEHPWSYGAGEGAGGLASLAVPQAAGANLLGRAAKGEALAAKYLTPILGSKAEAGLVTKLGSGALAGATQGAIHGLGTGTGEERLDNAIGEGIAGAPLGVAGSALGHVGGAAARKVAEKLGYATPMAARATAADLYKQSKALYKQAEDAGLQVRSASLNKLHTDIKSKLSKLAYDPSLREEHRGLENALGRLSNAKIPLTLEELDNIYRSTRPLSLNWTNPEGRMMANTFRKEFSNFLDQLKPQDIITKKGSASSIIGDWRNARHVWKQEEKMKLLEQAATDAEIDAEIRGVGGDLANAQRKNVGRLLKDIKRQKDFRWSPDEIQAMEEFVKGGVTRKVSRLAGSLSPLHNNMMGKLNLMHLLYSPTTGAIPAAAGVAGKYTEGKLMKAAEENLKDIIAAGGQSAKIPAANPMTSLKGRAVGVPTTVSPLFTPSAPVYAEDREERAAGGRLGNRDYPAKRLSRVERAAKRAMDSIALETKPLMDQPDQVIADALKLASQK